ncbi:MAG TPA: hypothetical protein VMJ75_04570 [Candidatus Acidoferrales bacterium]|nr:hypothetical protein [Candidatus Acidoferrales bacterium]
MRNLLFAGVPAMAALLLSIPEPAAAQSQKAPAKAYSPHRLADGHPDLQGTYDLATLTPVDRPSGAPAVYSKEEARKREIAAALQREQGDKAIAGDRPAPPKGGDGSVGPAGNVGGYNSGWLDPGSAFNVVNGEIRSSIVVDPPDGRVPPMIPAALQRMAAARARPTSDTQENANDPGLEKAPGAYDDPERRPLGERCLLGFGSTSGPPALPDYFYNNLHQIVQTPNAVMILTEMVHDARVVRMNAQHLPKSTRLWMGDSVGHWEGDTLVVDTTNFTAKTRFRGSTEDLHVIERFSRIDDRTLLYRFTIEDPATWARPWTGEYAWPATNGKIYEYACHEANYALTDILKGARLRDNEQAAAKAAK